MAKFWKNLSETYILSIRNQKNFFESSKISLTTIEMLSILLAFTFLIFLSSFLLFKYTSFGLLTGNQAQGKEKVLLLNEQADSLSQSIIQHKSYIENIQKIINGQDLSLLAENSSDSLEVDKINISEQTEEELALIEKVNSRDLLTIKSNKSVDIVDFQKPLDGVVSSEFNFENNHYGLDLVAPKNTAIKAIADGKVLYSTWSVEDGYSIILLHQNDFVSIYKHAEKLLKGVNDTIESGEAIAIIGNSGENTTGYHLHFELWSDGIPVNPEVYINIE